jgi:hypothetical protein
MTSFYDIQSGWLKSFTIHHVFVNGSIIKQLEIISADPDLFLVVLNILATTIRLVIVIIFGFSVGAIIVISEKVRKKEKRGQTFKSKIIDAQSHSKALEDMIKEFNK